jgi:hypothetical protein
MKTTYEVRFNHTAPIFGIESRQEAEAFIQREMGERRWDERVAIDGNGSGSTYYYLSQEDCDQDEDGSRAYACLSEELLNA